MPTVKKYVVQPKNVVVKEGAQLIRMKWRPEFSTKWNGRYDKTQAFIDSEVLRRCEPFIPMRTGVLRSSGIIHTVLGSGKVVWETPYARTQYYSKRKPGSQKGPLRGPYWFARMKAVHGKSIIAGAKKFMGG
jgi:hypothetical protein